MSMEVAFFADLDASSDIDKGSDGRFWTDDSICVDDGVWANGAAAWNTVRAYGQELVKMSDPPEPVQGEPVAWGGTMDLARYLERNTGRCWLESGDTRSYFFGDRDNPANDRWGQFYSNEENNYKSGYRTYCIEYNSGGYYCHSGGSWLVGE